jgi:hypothetical protein
MKEAPVTADRQQWQPVRAGSQTVRVTRPELSKPMAESRCLAGRRTGKGGHDQGPPV